MNRWKKLLLRLMLLAVLAYGFYRLALKPYWLLPLNYAVVMADDWIQTQKISTHWLAWLRSGVYAASFYFIGWVIGAVYTFILYQNSGPVR